MHKRVLVTGGARRLGALLCTQFAQDGWEVWCHYQHSDTDAQALVQQLRSSGHAAHAVAADLADASQRQRMLETIAQKSGPLQCLVNNASMFEPDAAEALDMVAARAQMEVNLMAPLHLSALFAAQLPADAPAGGACILHVLDQKVFNLNRDYFSYTVSKLALERTVGLQARALAPRIRVCGVAPGLMFLSGPQSQDNFDAASRVNLLGQPLDAAQVAATCVFLAGNPAITGTCLTVDNGQHCVPLERDVMFAVQDNAGSVQ